jgi:glycosyltransferase involved in cell wall biosynthesis
MSSPLFTIIIGTRNRAQHLRPTLESLAGLQLEVGTGAELILADNGSTDHTQAVLAEVTPALQSAGIEVRSVHEPQPGACRARNRALRAARGEYIFLADDDVRLPAEWLTTMSQPLRESRADVVAGGVRIAPHLLRDWMTPLQRGWLASTEEDKTQRPEEEPGRIISANMAFSKKVLETVPGFDEELGPGALGFCDDILFSLQMKEAGLRLFPAWHIEAEHHFDAARLTYASLKQRAISEGRSAGYFWYHWLYMPVRAPRLKERLFSLQLALMQRRNSPRDELSEGCNEDEMKLLQKVHCYRQYLVECRRPHNYEQRGLVKRNIS